MPVRQNTFVTKLTLLAVRFIAVMALLRNHMAVGVFISVVYSFTVFLILFRMKGVQEQVAAARTHS